MEILFIAPDEVTKYTPLNGNIDSDKLLPCIFNVQISVIEQMLGFDLYDKVLTDYTSGTLSGDYLVLLNKYIKPIMRYQAAAEYVEIGAYVVGNAGIFKKNPQDATSATKSEVDSLAQTLRATAQMYIERAERFLSGAGFSEYSSCKSNHTQVVQGWYFAH